MQVHILFFTKLINIDTPLFSLATLLFYFFFLRDFFYFLFHIYEIGDFFETY